MRLFHPAAAVVLLCPALAGAQSASQTSAAPTGDVTPAVSVAAGTEWLASSAYVWRGFLPNDEFVVQPNTWVRVGRVTVASWMNVRGTADGRHLTEHDFTVDYSQQAGAFTWSVGWVNYAFPQLDAGRYSNEFYAGVTHASAWAPTLKVFADVHEGTGVYVSAGASHAFAVTDSSLSLTPSLALGYNHRQWIQGTGVSDLNTGLKLTWAVHPRVSVSPFVNYSRSFMTSEFPSRLYGGLGLAIH